MRLERVDGLRGLHAAVDVALELDEVLVVAAQHDHVLGRREIEQEHRAQHAVEAEDAAVDVVAEQHQLGLRVGVRVGAIGRHLVEEVRLHEGGLQAAVAAVQVAQHGQLVALPGLRRRTDQDVTVEERLLAGELVDVLLARRACPRPRARCASSCAMARSTSSRSAVDLTLDGLGIARVVVLELLEERMHRACSESSTLRRARSTRYGARRPRPAPRRGRPRAARSARARNFTSAGWASPSAMISSSMVSISCFLARRGRSPGRSRSSAA